MNNAVSEANEIIDAIEIIVDKIVKKNSVQIYSGRCVSASAEGCSLEINGKINKVMYYGSTPVTNNVYRVFVPNDNMSMAFIIVP